MKFLVAFICATVLVQAALSAPTWDDLRVTWDPNPLSSWGFDALPRTQADAPGAYFYQRDDLCATKGSFLGRRFWYKNDPAVVLLYDVNGYIAGIQTSVSKSLYTPGPNRQGHPAIDDGDYWTFTAYFVDPSIICNGGRSAQQYQNQGTGTGLWIQNGTNPLKDLLNIPTDETNMPTTMWTFGHCFWTMGNHYWYNVRESMSCDEFFPFFLLFNKGGLNGFGFAVNAPLTSPRYEHPTPKVSSAFINPVPQCFYSDSSFSKLSTLHVYMTSSPRSNFC